MFLDYVVEVKLQQMSHAVRYRKFCKGRNYRHLAFIGLVSIPLICIMVEELTRLYCRCV
jgi:hypothetical protein